MNQQYGNCVIMEALIIIKVLAIIPVGGEMVGGPPAVSATTKTSAPPEETGDLIAARSAFTSQRHRQSQNPCLFFDFG